MPQLTLDRMLSHACSPVVAAKLITQLQATLAQPCAAIVTDASMMQVRLVPSCAARAC